MSKYGQTHGDMRGKLISINSLIFAAIALVFLTFVPTQSYAQGGPFDPPFGDPEPIANGICSAVPGDPDCMMGPMEPIANGICSMTPGDPDCVMVPTETDLGITITDNTDPVTAGNALTYTVNVSNNGEAVANAVTANVILPLGVTLVSKTGCPGGPMGSANCALGDIAAFGGAAGYSINVTVDAGTVGNIIANASVNDPNDINGANNNASEQTTVQAPPPSADLSITKTDGLTSVFADDRLTYTIVATNNGPDAATNVAVTDVFPAKLEGCSFSSVAAGGATGNVAAGAGNIDEFLNMPSGSSVTYTASCRVKDTATGTISNTASISSAVADPVAGNNSATDGDTVISAPASITVRNVTVPAGSTQAFATAVTGPGTNANSNLEDGQSITRTGLAAGTYGVTQAAHPDYDKALVCVDPSGGTSTAGGVGSVGLASGEDVVCTYTNTLKSADVSVTIDDGVTGVLPGGTLNFTVVATNNGPTDAGRVRFSASFGGSRTCSFTSVAAGGATDNSVVGAGSPRDTLNMPAGSTVTYSASCTSVTGTPNTALTSTASVFLLFGGDRDPSNDTASDTNTIVLPTGLIQVRQSVVPNTSAQSFNFAINNGATPAAFSLAHGGGQNFTLGLGSYQVTQTPPAGFETTVSCLGGGEGTRTAGTSAFIDLTAGAMVCNFRSVQQVADLQVSLSDNVDPAFPGDTVTYTAQVQNAGPIDAEGVKAAFTLPAGMTFVSTSGCAEDPNGTPSCSLGTIAAGSSTMFTVQATVDAETLGAVNANVSATSTTELINTTDDSANESTQIIALVPPVFTKVFTPDSVAFGGQSTLTFTINNASSTRAAENLSFTDNLPDGVIVRVGGSKSKTCEGGMVAADGGSISYAGGTLGAGDSCTISVDVISTSAGSKVNTTGDLTSSLGNSGTATDTLNVSEEEADLAITVSDDADPVSIGDTITYTVTVMNNGPQTAVAASVRFGRLPTHVRLTGALGCGAGSGPGLCALGDIASGSSKQFTATVDVNSEPFGPLNATFNAGSTTFDPDGANNTATESTLISNQAPVITAPSAEIKVLVKIAENQTAVTNVDATDDIDSEGSGLTYKITGGDDQALFSINVATGALSFKSAPDFETPLDKNKDNIYVVFVSVADSGALTDTITIGVQVTDVVENLPPDANAGPDQTVASGALVTLDGSGSTDPDKDKLTFKWTPPAGVTLSDVTAASPTFTAPAVAVGDPDKVLVFTVEANDGLEKDTDTVSITVRANVGVVISGLPAEFTGPETVTVTAVFDRSVTGFEAGDVTVTNGAVTGVTGGGTTYTVTIDTTGVGDVTVVIPAGGVQDAVGITNAVSNTLTSANQLLNLTTEQLVTYLYSRAQSLVSNQPELFKFLLNRVGGQFSFISTQGSMNFSASSNSDSPMWFSIRGSWSENGNTDTTYVLGAVGSHMKINENLLLGTMVQLDFARDENGAATTEGTGWLFGPYFVARHATQPIIFEGRLLYGQTDNQISPLGTYTDNFDSERWLAQARVTGEMGYDRVTLYPTAAFSYLSDSQESYFDTPGNFIPSQSIELTTFDFGLDFSLPMAVKKGDATLTGGVSGIYSSTSGTGPGASVVPNYDGGRGKVKLGLERRFSDESRLNLTSFYDGIGSGGFSSTGLGFSYEFRF